MKSLKLSEIAKDNSYIPEITTKMLNKTTFTNMVFNSPTLSLKDTVSKFILMPFSLLANSKAFFKKLDIGTRIALVITPLLSF